MKWKEGGRETFLKMHLVIDVFVLCVGQDIGTWYVIMEVMSTAAVITNILVSLGISNGEN